MTVVLNNEKLYLSFQHHLKTAVPGTQATKAMLCRKDHTPVLEAYSLCAAGDQYCKDKGRKVALTRLLKPLKKPLRSQVWQAYFDARGRV